MSSGTSPPAPATRLVGRATEVEDVLDLLDRARLVTLTGPPGVGKTRLAQAVCADWPGDDVVWVDLAPLRDPRQLHAELARALGGPAELGRLLVVDNCEHLLDLDPDLGSELAALLGSTSRLQVLTTSRERLRLAAEHEYAVPPLPMPAAEELDPDRLRDNPAVALLLDRAPPAVRLTPNTARALAEICIGLDGLPLAIELAAARLRVFTPSELAFRLGRRLSLLTSGPRDAPARHRDLRTAIAWSHDLLPEPERAVFRRLSVFPGEWTLAAAEGVCDGPGVLDAVESLLDKSLVRRVADDGDGDGGPARFTMLMSLREYAAEQLAEHGEVDDACGRHAAWFADRAREWEATIGTAAETETLPGLAPVRADLAVALDHARATDDAGRVAWLASALGWFGYTRGVLADSEGPLADLVAVAGDPRTDPEARAAARVTAGVVAYGLGRHEVATAQLAAFRSGRADQAERRTAIARAFLGHLARERGDLAEAAELYAAALATHERLGNTRGRAWAGHDLALLALDRERDEEAEPLLREALELFGSLDYDWGIALCSRLLATVLARRGAPAEVDEAARLLAHALRLHDAGGDRRGLAQCLEAVAEVATARGAAATAARLVGAAAVRRERAAAVATEAESRHLADLDARLDRGLGRAAAERERHAGRTMAPAAAVDLAARLVEVAAAEDGHAVTLTPRQREVAVQVAAGLTNRQIGRALGISEKTTEVHLHHVMEKLDVPSRAGVAAWVAARGLTPER